MSLEMKKQRKFFSSKDGRESLRAWLYERNWPSEVNWHGQKHIKCPGREGATWKLVGFGQYLAADFKMRDYVGFRCTGCGDMVQFYVSYPAPEGQSLKLEQLYVKP